MEKVENRARNGHMAAFLLVVYVAALTARGQSGPGSQMLAMTAPPGAVVHPAHVSGPIAASGGRYLPRAGACRAVHGCLPYWMDPNVVQWDIVTHLVCYAIIVLPDGTIDSTWQWPWTATIAAARARGIEVLPLITMGFNDDNNEMFLHDVEARRRLIETLRPLMTPYADGIYVDFEGNYSDRWASEMPGFARELRAAFQQDNPAFKVYAATPAMDWAEGWDMVEAATAFDGLYLMGYDFFGPFSTYSGPSSPLTTLSFCISNSLGYYYGRLMQTYPERVVLGVPYYANHWVTAGPEPYSDIRRFVEQIHYDRAATMSRVGTRRRFDPVSSTSWAVWNEGGEWHQLWLDDAESMARKYDAVTAWQLGGIGIWALGYDGASRELHDLIMERFFGTCDGARCVADVDDGSWTGMADGGVTVDDLLYYLFAYGGGLASADVDDGTSTGTRDGGVTIDDLLYYLLRYAAGC